MKKTNVVKLLTFLSHAYAQRMKFPLKGQKQTEMMVEVWHEFLERYEDRLILTAAKKLAVNNSDWPPSVGAIVKEAEDIVTPAEDKITGDEAWKLVLKAVRKYGYYKPDEGMNSLPEKVQEAVKNFGGFRAICHSKANSSYVRKQFVEIYDSIAERYRKYNYLPESVKENLKKLNDDCDQNYLE
ncbi:MULTISPECIES: replicative helicase loader/inhibitor [unclassified Halanaerobium]|uniref:replicative helicase loader/inhibitor n=1 Tax=unclassified Halanaerobium TaxID=2641197 RepID=UPI000E12A591|nr:MULTISPECIES: replicative helicase loader/inhibitor [unclassified Halanaerobium]RCW44736.1 loader and inhibitor of G40P protein [Halanaerobium sp. MA284_MarDTE_T2]RCW78358.1 loader and inhibitor of G40P protein [Halanaerobium sp. DL-01]